MLHYCINCKKHVEPKGHDALWGSAHKTYSFGVIIKKRPITHPFMRRTMGSLPSKVDLRPIMKAGGFVTFDQGQQGSCTANCGCGDRAFMEIKRQNYKQPFSRAFLYAVERKLLGTFPQDSGAEMINIGQVFTQYGVCFDKTMPYSQFDFSTYPNSSQLAEGLGWTCGTQHQLPTVADIKAAVYEASIDPTLGAARLGFPVSESFMNAVSNGGWVEIPTPSEKLLGGHAMLIIGYDDTLVHGSNTGYFYVLNSWGNVGDSSIIEGIFKFPYAWFTSSWVSQYGTDNWQQVNGSSPTPPPPVPPGTIVLSVSTATLINNGSNIVSYMISGVSVNDSVELDLIDSVGNVIQNVGVPSSTSTVVTGNIFYNGPYVGSAVLQAFDHTSNTGSNQVAVTIATPSVCPVGKSYASFGNLVARKFNRQGRFHYLVSS